MAYMSGNIKFLIYQIDEEDSPLRKRRKTNNNTNNANNNNAKAVWYWNGDSSKNSEQDVWIPYEDDLTEKIEKVNHTNYARQLGA